MIKRILFCVLVGLIVSSCTIGPNKTLIHDEQGNVVQTQEHGWFSFGQLQTADEMNTIYVGKGVGGDIEIPIPLTGGFSVFKIAFGYLNSQRMLLHRDTVLVLDVGIDVFNKGTAVTDTMLYGDNAVTGYAEFLESQPEEE